MLRTRGQTAPLQTANSKRGPCKRGPCKRGPANGLTVSAVDLQQEWSCAIQTHHLCNTGRSLGPPSGESHSAAATSGCRDGSPARYTRLMGTCTPVLLAHSSRACSACMVPSNPRTSCCFFSTRLPAKNARATRGVAAPSRWPVMFTLLCMQPAAHWGRCKPRRSTHPWPC